MTWTAVRSRASMQWARGRGVDKLPPCVCWEGTPSPTQPVAWSPWNSSMQTRETLTVPTQHPGPLSPSLRNQHYLGQTEPGDAPWFQLPPISPHAEGVSAPGGGGGRVPAEGAPSPDSHRRPVPARHQPHAPLSSREFWASIFSRKRLNQHTLPPTPRPNDHTTSPTGLGGLGVPRPTAGCWNHARHPHPPPAALCSSHTRHQGGKAAARTYGTGSGRPWAGTPAAGSCRPQACPP